MYASMSLQQTRVSLFFFFPFFPLLLSAFSVLSCSLALSRERYCLQSQRRFDKSQKVMTADSTRKRRPLVPPVLCLAYSPSFSSLNNMSVFQHDLYKGKVVFVVRPALSHPLPVLPTFSSPFGFSRSADRWRKRHLSGYRQSTDAACVHPSRPLPRPFR